MYCSFMKLWAVSKARQSCKYVRVRVRVPLRLFRSVTERLIGRDARLSLEGLVRGVRGPERSRTCVMDVVSVRLVIKQAHVIV